MSMRILQSDYMHWAKNQRPVRYHLASSEVPHFALERLPLTLADLDLTGASAYRYAPLREAIAAKEGVPPEWVVAADGTSMANMLAMAALVAPGDEVLVEQPTYEPMLAVLAFLGARVTRFERRAPAFELDPEAVARAITPATTLIVITNLHNPSGVCTDEKMLRSIASLGPRILVDEVYRDAAFADAPRSAVHLSERFVATNSLTKVYGLSGIRCGWILAEPTLAERMWRLNELFGVAQVHAGERLGCIALAHLDEVAAGTAERLTRNRALANAFFARRRDVECAPMVHGITAFPRLLRGDPEALDDRLRTRFDTSIVPGGWFEMPDHFRIGVGGQSEIVEEGLAERTPNPETELKSVNDYTLLVAVVLSAQATDASVNIATRELFQTVNTPAAMVALGEERLKQHIKTIGLFNIKAKNVIVLSQALIDRHGGEVPADRDALEALPGVGRKTANVVMNTAFGAEAFAVDTHVFRVSNRTGLAPGKTVVEVETKLDRVTPQPYRRDAHHLLILHGRYVCKARTPECWRCVIADICRYKSKTPPPGDRAAEKKVRAAKAGPGLAT